MRDIKFRGKRIDNGEWVYGYYWKSMIKDSQYIIIGNISDMQLYPVIPETVGQFTGLTDKNDVEIYEGDVYKTTKYSGTPGKFYRFIGQILYAPTSFIVNGVKQYFGMNSDLNALGIVIGNIHDNPELINNEI